MSEHDLLRDPTPEEFIAAEATVDRGEQHQLEPAPFVTGGGFALAGRALTIWHPAAAITTLFWLLNAAFPKRDKASDGIRASAAHSKANPNSGHEPNARGFVLAMDVDEDFGKHGDAMRLANELCALAREGRDGGLLRYVIYEDRIASATANNWHWRGSGYGHHKHLHIEFWPKAETDARTLPLAILGTTKVATKPVGKQWDGIVPALAAVLTSMAGVKNPAAWRLACRLADLGFYTGPVLPRGRQGYPAKAVAAWQESIGAQPTGKYGPKAHARIFPE